MRLARFFVKILPLIGFAGLTLAGSGFASAQDDAGKLTAAVRELADDISNYMKQNAQTNELSLGAFMSAQPELGAGSGAAIKRLLGEELTRRGIVVKQLGPRFSCKGEFTFYRDGADSGKVAIEAVLRERNVKRKNFTTEIFDVSDVAVLMGATGKLPTDPQERTEALLTSITNPQPEVEPSPLKEAQGVKARAVAVRNADYALEIWRLKPDKVGVRNPSDSDYEPVPVDELQGGVLFVNLEPENLYAVRLVNNTDRLAAATLTIDGLNMFTFSTVPAYKALGKVLVPPGPNGVMIKGWHYTNAESFAFEVCDVGEAAVSKVRTEGIEIDEEIGAITARFAIAVDVAKGEEFPPGEPRAASLGTAQGPKVGQTYSDMRVKIGQDREVITVRYSHPLPEA